MMVAESNQLLVARRHEWMDASSNAYKVFLIAFASEQTRAQIQENVIYKHDIMIAIGAAVFCAGANSLPLAPQIAELCPSCFENAAQLEPSFVGSSLETYARLIASCPDTFADPKDAIRTLFQFSDREDTDIQLSLLTGFRAIVKAKPEFLEPRWRLPRGLRRVGRLR
jgi:hypothetical protein